MQLLPLDHVHCHAGQIDLIPLPGDIDSGLRRYELHKHHPEAVHVALLGELIAPMVLGIDVARRALRGGGNVGGIEWEEPREAKVGNFDAEVSVEKNIVGLDVAVDDLWLNGVEVVEGVSGFNRDAHPNVPWEGRLGGQRAMDVVRDCSIGHKFVHEEELATVPRGASIEADEILVPEEREDLNFIQELLDPPEVILVQALYCNYSAILELAFVDCAKAAIAEFLGVIKAICGSIKLFIFEDGGVYR